MESTIMKSLTPAAIVVELDRYIVGQNNAKRAVAVALRNRWRRQQVEGELKDEISPKNIIMIGPTGVGKTEIARRLAKLAKAPFVKVEASKFTEVGYIGRDVDSIVRDLVEVSVTLVRQEAAEKVRPTAKENAEERLLDILLPAKPQATSMSDSPQDNGGTREKLRSMLHDGKLDKRDVEIDVTEDGGQFLQIFGGAGGGVDEMGLSGLKDMLGNMTKKTRRRKAKVPEALEALTEQEVDKLIDHDTLAREAVSRAENGGIVFLDEIDKIAGREGKSGPDVSRQGVQRDLLPIVEGSTVTTKYGPVSTEHVLFVAAGAFHTAKPSDLIPELQGRFPIRVELEGLSKEHFIRILTEPKNALIKQYHALLATEGVEVIFTDEAIAEIARLAEVVNTRSHNIGARRLHTILERLLDDLLFSSPDMGEQTVSITDSYVREQLHGIVEDENLSNYIL